jgi:hypothetical protein
MKYAQARFSLVPPGNGSTGSECPAPVSSVPGTGRYRLVMSSVLVPHTDWSTGRGRRPTAARAACGLRGGRQRAEVATGWSMVPR